MWLLYVFIGATVSLLITGVLVLTGWILNVRIYAVKDLLKAGDISGAWLSWTGGSMVLVLFAASMVLIEPAAASSGIPGLIAYLNGVEPNGGVSPVTGKKTSFTSWQTMLAKTAGMIASVPSGLCIGPEGPIIHVSALMAHWTCIAAQEIEQVCFVCYCYFFVGVLIDATSAASTLTDPNFFFWNFFLEFFFDFK
jgi:chloride channel 7